MNSRKQNRPVRPTFGRRIWLHLILVLILFGAFAASLPAAETLAPDDAALLTARAKAISEVFVSRDYDTLIEMTHPAVVRSSGGEDKLIEQLKQAMIQLDQAGFTILEDSLGEPTQVYRSINELVCFYPRTMVMKVSGQVVQTTGFLICARKQSGGPWLFIDGEMLQKNPALLRQVFPGLPTDIKVPASKSEIVE